jgi:hypothetical protein
MRPPTVRPIGHFFYRQQSIVKSFPRLVSKLGFFPESPQLSRAWIPAFATAPRYRAISQVSEMHPRMKCLSTVAPCSIMAPKLKYGFWLRHPRLIYLTGSHFVVLCEGRRGKSRHRIHFATRCSWLAMSADPFPRLRTLRSASINVICSGFTLSPETYTTLPDHGFGAPGK